MATDVLLGPRLKIERAGNHIYELIALTPFRTGGHGYEFIEHSDSKPGGPQFVGLRFLPAPPKASVVLGEAIYQLRSALDVAAVAMARHNMPGCSVKDVYFPFAKDAVDLLDMGTSKRPGSQRKIRKLSDQARAVINDFKPYPKGNEALCGLNTLRNEDAHIELLTVATFSTDLLRLVPGGDLRIGAFTGRMMGGRLDETLRVDVTDLVASVRDFLPDLQTQSQIVTSVCLTNSGIFEGRPVIETLTKLHSEVSEVVRLLENTL
jgi:hypothetical protein